MIDSRGALVATLFLIACGSSPDNGPRADVRTELHGLGLDGRLAASDSAVYVQNDEGVQVFSSQSEGLRQVLDQGYRACPWPSYASPSERVNDVKITYGADSAYISRPFCGLWSVSLQDPSKVTPIVRVTGASQEDRAGAWGDGTLRRVSPFKIAAAPDGDGLLVCLGGDVGEDVQLWSATRDGKPGEMVAKVDGDCTEIVRDDSGAFLSVSNGVYRWDRSSRAMTRIATLSTAAGAESLQATAAHLFYLEGDQIMRVGRDGKGLTRIERDPADSASLTRFIADDRNLYVATQAKVVRIPQDGGQTETMVVAASESRVATENGFVKAGEDLWFVLNQWEGKGEQKPYLARVPK
jgi:hypothetical protein